MSDDEEIDLGQYKKESNVSQKTAVIQPLIESKNVEDQNVNVIQPPKSVSQSSKSHHAKKTENKKRENLVNKNGELDPDINELDAIAELLETVKKQYVNEKKNRRLNLIYRIVERFLKRNNYQEQN